MLKLISSLLFVVLLGCAHASEYHEQLLLRPLPPSSLLASFNFRSNTSSKAFEGQNFRFFPRSLGQILQYANTRELHLRFSLGRWDAESWGARPWGGAQEGGTGVELWAWVEAGTDEEADRRWLTLTNALSGLFCASLNFIDSTRTTRPVMSFVPSGDHANSTMSKLHLLHGTLPREVVCTENLTPFLKLLPCKGKAGISSLLDGHKLFDASWQSMSIDVRPTCSEDSGECLLEINQTIDMVLDIERSKRPRDDPIPRPVRYEDLKCDTSKPYHSESTCFPLEEAAGQDWSLSQIFGHPLRGSCPLSDDDTESVCISVPHGRDVYTSGGAIERKDDSGYLRCFKLSEQEFEMVLPPQDFQERSPVEEPLLYADRSFTGYGQEHGGVQAILRNPSQTDAVNIVYMESLPWFMKLYLHTLKAKINGAASNSIQDIYYRPALDRRRGSQVEIGMMIPANSTVVLTYEFEKAILRYTEYPPDANRGFDIASAVITIGNASIRTTSLLLPLPTPDFSMPYNVIILTSTVMALAFGFIFNLLVRRFVGADEVDKLDLKAVRLKVVAALRSSMKKLAHKDKTMKTD
ncbi:MAG: Subunit of the glycosylphosphatidylinositol transamidase complex-like protein [Claussenomyces sp. TS43310]|nr:MAG: Subunit of the glycosylphosphatidylinositol transamidase complex-like protein [Claussenomyces sp. TS43310]